MKKTLINGPEGKIEAQIHFSNRNLDLALVICHPHPQYGGSMENNVVQAIFHLFKEEGFTVACFNFRGVGQTEGVYDNGRGEQQDLMAICNYLLEKRKNVSKFILCGYSFGATTAGAILGDSEKFIGYIAISYPITLIPDFLNGVHISKPKYFLMGENDDFTSMRALQDFYSTLPLPKNIKLYPNVDHFWRGTEKILAKNIFEWYLETFSD